MLVVDVPFGRQVVLTVGHAVGIDPGMQFHAAAVSFVNHILQGVPQGLGGHAGLATDPLAPGFQRAGIGRVGLGTHLPDDGVHAGLLQQVELLAQVGLVLLGSVVGKLLLADDMQPGTAEFPLGSLRL